MEIRDRIKELRRVPAKELRPNPKNWRIHSKAQADAMRGVLAQVGYADAVLARETEHGLMLIDGHLRAETTPESMIPVLILDVTAEEADLILATHDPLAAMAETDVKLLDELTRSIKVQSEAVQAMLSETLGQISTKPGNTDPDDIPEQPPAVVKPGELWQLGNHRLLCGDATNAEDVGRVMNGEKSDLCFTSPPYNLGASVGLRNGAFKGQNTAYPGVSGDDDPQQWRNMMDCFLGEALNCCQYAAINVQLLAGNKRELIGWLANFADRVADVYVWVKSNPQPAMAERVASSAFEFVVLLSAEPNPTRAISTASFHRGTFCNVHTSAVGNNSHTDGSHGATFPVDLAVHYVGALTGHGASIYDPFLGSGTTLIAAEKTNRRCFGIEISPHYCDVTIKRWEDFTGRKAERIDV